MKENKFIKTFETFTKSGLNEGAEWFSGSNMEDNLYDSTPEFEKFLKDAKKGDTFMVQGQGDDVYVCTTASLKKSTISVEMITYNGTGSPEQAIILDRKKVTLKDEDESFDGKEECIFYAIQDGSGSDEVFVMPLSMY